MRRASAGHRRLPLARAMVRGTQKLNFPSERFRSFSGLITDWNATRRRKIRQPVNLT